MIIIRSIFGVFFSAINRPFYYLKRLLAPFFYLMYDMKVTIDLSSMCLTTSQMDKVGVIGIIVYANTANCNLFKDSIYISA